MARKGPLIDHLATSVACETKRLRKRGARNVAGESWISGPRTPGLRLLAGPRSALHREVGINNLGKAEFPTLVTLGSSSLFVPTYSRGYLATRRVAGSLAANHCTGDTILRPFAERNGACRLVNTVGCHEQSRGSSRFQNYGEQTLVKRQQPVAASGAHDTICNVAVKMTMLLLEKRSVRGLLSGCATFARRCWRTAWVLRSSDRRLGAE